MIKKYCKKFSVWKKEPKFQFIGSSKKKVLNKRKTALKKGPKGIIILFKNNNSV